MTSVPPLLRQLTDHLTSLGVNDASKPPDWIGAAELCWLDWGAVTVHGLDLPVTARVAQTVGGLHDLVADVVRHQRGSSEAAPPGAVPFLAFLLGTAAHAAELDDTLPGCMAHAGGPVVSAAAAMGLWLRSSGKALLEAIAVGYEAIDRVGRAMNAPPSMAVHARGFHPTGVLGPLGAAAASARLMGLDPNRVTHALALATSMGGGLLEFFTGGDTKPLHVGQAAASGVLAASLARSGLQGPIRALEGRDGFLRVYAGNAWDPGPLVEYGDSGELAVQRTLRKYHACCHHCHPAVETWRLLQRKNAFDLEAVVAVEAALPRMAVYQVGLPTQEKRQPATPTEARFSLPYALAAWSVVGHLGPQAFERHRLADPRILRLAQRVTVREDPSMDEVFSQGRMPARVKVRLQDGRSLEATLVLGSQLPHDDERSRLREKLRTLLGSRGQADHAENTWQLLERSSHDGPATLLESIGSNPAIWGGDAP